MIEVEIFIPERDEEENPFHPDLFTAWENQAIKLFGGLSLMPGHVQGWWEDPQEVLVKDMLRRYVFACDGLPDLGQIAGLAKLAKDLFRQQGIYVRYLGVGEVL